MSVMHPSRDVEFDEGKFTELILYIASASKDDPRFGAVKLNKLLYFSDFTHYAHTGKAITGARYQRLEQGPAAVQMMPTLNKIESNEDGRVIKMEYFGYFQERLEPFRDPTTSLFTKDEIARVNQIIKKFWNFNAAQISEWSHTVGVGYIGWQIAKNHDIIPYNSVFLASPDTLTDGEIAYGQQMARELGFA